MSKAFTAAAYLDKARRAVEGAQVLLTAGDTEGACSRAYYAMFDAAQWLNLTVGRKTHYVAVPRQGRKLKVLSTMRHHYARADLLNCQIDANRVFGGGIMEQEGWGGLT